MSNLTPLNLSANKSVAQRIAEKSASMRQDTPTDSDGNPITPTAYIYDDNGKLTAIREAHT